MFTNKISERVSLTSRSSSANLSLLPELDPDAFDDITLSLPL